MRSIITYPNPILEKKAELVTFPLNTENKELISEMWAMVKGKGVGLAAPQVAVSKQICIIHLSEDSELKKRFKQPDFVMINPVITFQSKLESLMIEGCLSFPGDYYEIWRPANIIVEYYNDEGNKKVLKAKDWLSRVIQHEVDHLYGNIFIKMGGKKLKEEDLKGDIID